VLAGQLVVIPDEDVGEQADRLVDVDDPVLRDSGVGVLRELEYSIDPARAVGEDLYGE
jgi:hypothetical protein